MTESCEVCGTGKNPGGYEIISSEDIKNELATLKPGVWELTSDEKWLVRKFACSNWQAAVDCINAVGEIAERSEIQHHPDIFLTNYRNLEIRISTHNTSSLTRKDFILAREIDKVPINYSKAWLKSHPEAN